VYANPEIKTNIGCVIFLDKKEIAATLLAKGHGLIEVNTPNHNAETEPINTSVIYFLLENQ
jgi:hypothetical protein